VAAALAHRQPIQLAASADTQRGWALPLPAIKVAVQAIILQMAAAKEWGDANFAKLDPLTVSMAHPDGMIALLSGKGEIDNHFTSPPFQ
jgi:NitT/TauT family transport system substrate-binding protein